VIASLLPSREATSKGENEMAKGKKLATAKKLEKKQTTKPWKY